jgi:hypothetical protein
MKPEPEWKVVTQVEGSGSDVTFARSLRKNLSRLSTLQVVGGSCCFSFDATYRTIAESIYNRQRFF